MAMFRAKVVYSPDKKLAGKRWAGKTRTTNVKMAGYTGDPADIDVEYVKKFAEDNNLFPGATSVTFEKVNAPVEPTLEQIVEQAPKK